MLLWKLLNGRLDVQLLLATNFLKTRSSSKGLFDVPNTIKFSLNCNCFVVCTQTANALIHLKVLDFNGSFETFKLKLRI